MAQTVRPVADITLVGYGSYACRERTNSRRQRPQHGTHDAVASRLLAEERRHIKDRRPGAARVEFCMSQGSRRSSTSDTMNPNAGQPPDCVDRSNHLRACPLSPRRRYQFPRP